MIRALTFGLLLVASFSDVSAQDSTARSFAIEWTGGTIGSAAGVALGVWIVRPERCDNEDIACILERLGTIGLITSITAPAGSYGLGRAFDSEPHAIGSLIGGLVGAAAGAGAVRLFDEAGVRTEGTAALVVYTLSQGLITALGSRLGAALRSD